MNIILLGASGRMGREIATQAAEQGIEISHSIHSFAELQNASSSGSEVAIDFTLPDQVVQNVAFLAEKNINVVVGTTGWYDHMEEVKKIVAEYGIGFLWSANFSLGVNIFWKILGDAARYMNSVPEYDVFAHEFHHSQKKDSPSGTALKTAEILLSHIDRKKTLQTETLQRAIQPEELHFSSTRGGSVPGTHSVYFDSPADTIEITHTARNRSGFALGALNAAKWLKGKRGLFEMEDFVEDVLKKKGI